MIVNEYAFIGNELYIHELFFCLYCSGLQRVFSVTFDAFVIGYVAVRWNNENKNKPKKTVYIYIYKKETDIEIMNDRDRMGL